MNKRENKSLVNVYKNYLAIGATILLVTWAVALLTISVLPGPYTFDLFGIVAERSNDSSSVTVNPLAIVTGLIIIPVLLTLFEVVVRKNRS